MQDGKMVCRQVERIPASHFLALTLRIDVASRHSAGVSSEKCGGSAFNAEMPGSVHLFECRHWTALDFMGRLQSLKAQIICSK
jgi:hypothetical protein